MSNICGNASAILYLSTTAITIIFNSMSLNKSTNLEIIILSHYPAFDMFARLNMLPKQQNSFLLTQSCASMDISMDCIKFNSHQRVLRYIFYHELPFVARNGYVMFDIYMFFLCIFYRNNELKYKCYIRISTFSFIAHFSFIILVVSYFVMQSKCHNSSIHMKICVPYSICRNNALIQANN